MNGIKKTDNESILDYKIRLCSNKYRYNINWKEISKLMNECAGEDLSSSVYRKWWYGFSQGMEYSSSSKEENKNKNVIDNVSTREFRDKNYHMEKIKYQMADQRRELNNVKRWEARLDDLEGLILQEISNLADDKPIHWTNKLSTGELTVSDNKEGVLLLSDWHRGLFAKNYWNNFDDAEFNRRLKRLVSKTIEYGLQHHIRKLNVFGLGDFVNGIIHVTTRISNSEDVITQTMKMCEVMSEMLAEFARHFDLIDYYHARGNHDRVSPNKHDELAKESFADFIPFYLEARLSHIPTIRFHKNEYDDEIIVTEICGKKIFAVHGHKDRISNVVESLSLMTRIVPDYVFMGHYHHHEENEHQGVEIIINSSFSGVDEYAKDIRKISNPAQKFIVFDDHEGRLCTYNIRLNV